MAKNPSWNDPVKFSFAFGGKDGVPYPVDRKAMDESIQILKSQCKKPKSARKRSYARFRGCDGLFPRTQTLKTRKFITTFEESPDA